MQSYRLKSYPRKDRSPTVNWPKKKEMGVGRVWKTESLQTEDPDCSGPITTFGQLDVSLGEILGLFYRNKHRSSVFRLEKMGDL